MRGLANSNYVSYSQAAPHQPHKTHAATLLTSVNILILQSWIISNSSEDTESCNSLTVACSSTISTTAFTISCTADVKYWNCVRTHNFSPQTHHRRHPYLEPTSLNNTPWHPYAPFCAEEHSILSRTILFLQCLQDFATSLQVGLANINHGHDFQPCWPELWIPVD